MQGISACCLTVWTLADVAHGNDGLADNCSHIFYVTVRRQACHLLGAVFLLLFKSMFSSFVFC